MKTIKQLKKFQEKAEDLALKKAPYNDENSLASLLLIQNSLLIEIIERLDNKQY